MYAKPLLIGLLLALLVGGSLLPATPAAATSGSVEPPVGAPGTTFTFTASGFDSSERVGMWLVRPDGRTRQLDPEDYINYFADESGTVTWTWTPGELAPGGGWMAMAKGIISRVEVGVPFTVENDLGNLPPSSWQVSPTSGPPGTTFTFVARSPAFIPGEQVGSWFLDPFGRVLDVAEGQSVDPRGQIFRIWTAPPDISGGSWLFRARGISSGFSIDIPFTIEGPVEIPTDEPPPPFEVAPQVGTPGTTFTFTAGGFQRSELVGTWFVQPDGTELDAEPWIQADETGLLTWRWAAPPGTQTGEWRFVLSGTQTNGQQQLIFRIDNGTSPGPVAGPATSVTPSIGPPNTVFTFSVEGFRPGEALRFWPEDARGEQVIGTAEETEANAEGRAVWEWEAPERMNPGPWTMQIRGRVSPQVVGIPFRISRPGPVPPVLPQGVSPEVGAPGTTFNFFVRDFAGSEDLDIWISQQGAEHASSTRDRRYEIRDLETDHDGEADWSWTAPPDIQDGLWNLYARGLRTRDLRVIPFTVVRDAPPPALPYGVTPEGGPPGTTFTFFGEGFERGDRVGYWLTQPDGTIVRAGDEEDFEADEIGADQQGRVEISWVAPIDAPSGVWTLSMRTSKPEGLDEDITYLIRFTID